MGRTVTPFSLVLSEQEKRLRKFRRALRAEDQEHFDALFEFARLNTQAAVQMAALDPMEPILLLMLIELRKEIESLRARLSELEEKERQALLAPHEEHKD
ncbi:MAG TPA: hypothetical protein VJ302_10945 [Blastocatellia bacterium]|nr:hypothetical protein [Blastocatellia bacterium]